MINYINGDEALFEDASLPRDSFGFIIRTGQQTRNDELKNLSITFSQYYIEGEEYTEENKESKVQFTDKTKTEGNPYCNLKEGGVEIIKGGFYFIQVVGIFKPVNSSVDTVETQILYNADDVITKTKVRNIDTEDYLTTTYVGNFKAGTIIRIGHKCNQNHDYKVELNLYRLS